MELVLLIYGVLVFGGIVGVTIWAVRTLVKRKKADDRAPEEAARGQVVEKNTLDMSEGAGSRIITRLRKEDEFARRRP